jgi:hypothetical protein
VCKIYRGTIVPCFGVRYQGIHGSFKMSPNKQQSMPSQDSRDQKQQMQCGMPCQTALMINHELSQAITIMLSQEKWL